MIGKLLTTSALVIVLSGGAYAAPATTAASDTAATTSTMMTSGYTMATTDALASKIIGSKVYDGTAQDAKEIGTVKDLVLNQQGDIKAAVIGVGGFLGVGEKAVAVDYPELKWAMNTDGSNRATLATSKDALNAAPTFKWPDKTNDNEAINNAPAGAAMAPAATGAAMARNQAAADQNAMAANADSAPAAPTVDVDPSKLSPVDIGSMKSDDLKGIDVISPSGDKLGSIGDFLLTKDGQVDAVIVDFGGFLGIGTKQVAIAYNGLKFLTDTNNKRYLEVNVTKDALNSQEAYNKDSYATDRSKQLMTVNS